MIKIIYFAVIGYKEILSYYTIMAKTKLRNIYNDFGLRLDVREARKLLGLPKTAPKAEVHHLLREFYYELNEETKRQPLLLQR